MKSISLFEFFAYLDVNNSNKITNLEFKVGLFNLEIQMPEQDVKAVWNSFDKVEKNKVTFSIFFNRFLGAGALDLIKFDDTLENLIKKFSFVIRKVGNYEEIF